MIHAMVRPYSDAKRPPNRPTEQSSDAKHNGNEENRFLQKIGQKTSHHTKHR